MWWFALFLIGMSLVIVLVASLVIYECGVKGSGGGLGGVFMFVVIQALVMCVAVLMSRTLGLGHPSASISLDQGAIYEVVGVVAVDEGFVVGLRSAAGGSVRFYRVTERPPTATYVQVKEYSGKNVLIPFPTPTRSPEGPGPSGE